MASSNNSKIISKASPHTIMKFKLVEEYIKAWAQKLMLNSSCYGLVFIDCMCNSGVYTYNGETVEGTPVRVAKVLLDVARSYPQKQVQIYLNDNSQEKVDELKKHLPVDEGNFKIIVTAKDRDELLETIGPQLYGRQHMHYFLFYDPYDASINWPVLIPFLRNWGEVMINHMVSDTIRAITQVRREATKEKYANTTTDSQSQGGTGAAKPVSEISPPAVNTAESSSFSSMVESSDIQATDATSTADNGISAPVAESSAGENADEADQETPVDLFDREEVMKFINDAGLLSYNVRAVRINNYLTSLFKMAHLLTMSGLHRIPNSTILAPNNFLVSTFAGTHTR